MKYSDAVDEAKWAADILDRALPLPRGDNEIRVIKNPMRCFGTCRKKDGGYLIEVATRIREHRASGSTRVRSVTLAELIDTMAHEWAHALNRSEGLRRTTERAAHGDAWGRHYSRCYRALFFPRGRPRSKPKRSR